MIPVVWQNWFLSIKNKHNFVEFPVKDLDDDLANLYFNKERGHWKIYLNCCSTEGKFFQTSRLVEFNAEEGLVKTINGSVYKLGEPYNNLQITNLRNYFRKID